MSISIEAASVMLTLASGAAVERPSRARVGPNGVAAIALAVTLWMPLTIATPEAAAQMCETFPPLSSDEDPPVDCSVRDWRRRTSYWLGSQDPGSSCECNTEAECAAQRAERQGCLPASCFVGCIPSSAFAEWGCLNLDADATLCESAEPFDMTVLLSTSHVSLDCRGQHIAPTTTERPRGIAAVYESSLEGISIRDCVIRRVASEHQHGSAIGIDLQRFFRGDEDGLESSCPHELDVVPGAPSDALLGHRHVRIEGSSVIGFDIGVYVGQNSRYVDLDHLGIYESESIGVYVEAGTRDSRIGFSEIEGTMAREGVALDSCERVLVEHNVFRRNGVTRADGNRVGLTLYHNCGELNGSVCPVSRPLGASWNVIRFNTFDGDDVLVAPRQYQGHVPGFCSDPQYGHENRTMDSAGHNQLYANRFVGGADLGVQDGPVLIHGNHFDGRLSVGVARPDTCTVCPARHVTGRIEENSFGPNATIATPGTTGLAWVNNVEEGGTCRASGPTTTAVENQCRPEHTLVLEGQVLGAGLLPLLLDP